MSRCKCKICLDSGYIAISCSDPSIIVALIDVGGSDLADYKLQKCSCRTPSKGETWKKEVKQADKKQGVQQRLAV